jgi:hypothetical protein
MKKVILVLSIFAAALMAAIIQLYLMVPTPVANSVISEKPEKSMGGQAAVLLPNNMTANQHRLLNMARAVAVENNFKNPEIMQAILLQETMAGGMESYKVANPGPDAYFGPMQVKLAAARDVLKQWPSLYDRFGFHTKTDDEVKANLILNERFNMEIAAKYLTILRQTYGFNGRELVNAYNRGPGGVKMVDASFHYAIGAERKLAAFNRVSGQQRRH